VSLTEKDKYWAVHFGSDPEVFDFQGHIDPNTPDTNRVMRTWNQKGNGACKAYRLGEDCFKTREEAISAVISELRIHYESCETRLSDIHSEILRWRREQFRKVKP
jgi:hypothetical protein